MKDAQNLKINVGDIVFVCNTTHKPPRPWVKCEVTRVSKYDIICTNIETGEKQFGGYWTEPQFIRKKLSKLELALK